MLFGSKTVTWWFESKSDPRFKGSGSCQGLFYVYEEVSRAIELIEKEYGVTAPNDIEYGGVKE